MLTLKELKHVLLLDESESVAEAAHKAGMSQPGLSQSIASVEKKLGVQLFVRNRKKLMPTKYGNLVAARARGILNQIDQLDGDLDSLRNAHLGIAKFAIGPAAASLFLAHAVKHFYKETGGAHPHFRIAFWDTAEAALIENDISFFVGGFLKPFKDPRFRTQPFVRDGLVAVVRAQHPLAFKKAVALKELIQFPVLTYDTRQFVFWRSLQDERDLALLHRHVPAASMENPLAAADIVASTDYVLLVLEVSWQLFDAAGKLVRVDVSDLRGTAHMQIVFNAGHVVSEVEKKMLESFAFAKKQIEYASKK